jgi:uncharacterized protein YlxW (UPF0749 family)
MKRFFDLYTIIALTVILLAVIAEILFPPTNWVAVVWMVITAIWVGCARSDQLTAEDWKQLYDWRSKENAQLQERVGDLRKQNSDYAEKYQTAVQDLNSATRKVEELTTALETKKSISKTVRKKREDYTDQEKARIKNEMKSAGLVPGKED